MGSMEVAASVQLSNSKLLQEDKQKQYGFHSPMTIQFSTHNTISMQVKKNTDGEKYGSSHLHTTHGYSMLPLTLACMAVCTSGRFKYLVE
jgi:hypothetical protein